MYMCTINTVDIAPISVAKNKSNFESSFGKIELKYIYVDITSCVSLHQH